MPSTPAPTTPALDTPEGLRALRDQLGLTRVDLAERLGKSPRTIEAYEQGKIPIPLATRLMLAEVVKRAPKSKAEKSPKKS